MSDTLWLLRVDKLKGEHQGRVGELVLRDSFDIIWGCANSGPGRLGIPEVMQTDRLVLLESSGPVFLSGTVRTAVGGMEVRSIPDRREAKKLSEQEETRLS